MDHNKACSLANKYKTPLFILYQGRVIKNVERYKRAFGKYKGGFKLAYSVKTNPMLAYLKVFRDQGVMAEVCTSSDIYAARKVGFSGRDIIFDGLTKSDEELEIALKKGFFLINIESVSEAGRLSKLAKKLRKRIRVGIRLAFPSSRVAVKSLLGVSYDRFGVSRKSGDFDEVIKIIMANKYLELIGLHCHTGSNQKKAGRVCVGVDQMIQAMVYLRDEYGVGISVLNIGGGLGVEKISAYGVFNLGLNLGKRFFNRPLNMNHEKMDFEAVVSEILNHLVTALDEHGLEKPLLMAEPGRALVGESTDLLGAIIDQKKSDIKNWLICDAGTNLLPPLTMYSEYHDIEVISKEKYSRKMCSVSGPLLYSADIIASDRRLPWGGIGDFVLIKNVGAYFNCQSSQFLYPRAATVAIDEKGKSRLVQRREKVSDIFARDLK